MRRNGKIYEENSEQAFGIRCVLKEDWQSFDYPCELPCRSALIIQYQQSERSFAQPCENLHVKDSVYTPPSPRFKSGSGLKREENRFSDGEKMQTRKKILEIVN